MKPSQPPPRKSFFHHATLFKMASIPMISHGCMPIILFFLTQQLLFKCVQKLGQEWAQLALALAGLVLELAKWGRNDGLSRCWDVLEGRKTPAQD